MDIALEKHKLRERMLVARRQISPAMAANAAQSVGRHFADHPILAFAESFAGYVAMRGELDVMPVFDLMARYNKQSALPCAAPNNGLRFRAWKRGEPLERHALGMQEPLPIAASVIPAIILVPLLAFDGIGNRLGYGAGYYDRAMQTLRQFTPTPLFIGVGYGLQEVPLVPTEPHDTPLDGILTELGVSMFR